MGADLPFQVHPVHDAYAPIQKTTIFQALCAMQQSGTVCASL
jgi:hypothetical protein